MNTEIIAVGSELLLANSQYKCQYISNNLSDLGINVYYHTVVGTTQPVYGVLKIASGGAI